MENLLNDLVKLHNTMSAIETKGENTKIMCDCLRFLEQKIEEVSKSAKTENKEEV